MVKRYDTRLDREPLGMTEPPQAFSMMYFCFPPGAYPQNIKSVQVAIV
jgi:hypothetical protein